MAADNDPVPAVGPIDVGGWRKILWQRLCDTALAACQGEGSDAEQAEAAEALGLSGPGRLREIHLQRTGRPLALHLDPRHLHRCADAWAVECPLGKDPYCPRVLQVKEVAARLLRAKEAALRGVPVDIAQASARGELPGTHALTRTTAFLEGGMGRRRKVLLLLSHDTTGQGTQAAGWAAYERAGRFVAASDLDLEGRDSGRVPDCLAAGLLAVDGVELQHRPSTYELLEAIVGHRCRRKLRTILTSRHLSHEVLGVLPAKVVRRFRDLGEVVPVVPEPLR